jgi:hypothetical protein
MQVGESAEDLERARRSMSMSAARSPAPITCAELAELLERLQRAEAEVRRSAGS